MARAATTVATVMAEMVDTAERADTAETVHTAELVEMQQMVETLEIPQAASSSKTQGSGDINAHGGDANGGKGGDGGNANGGYGGSVFVCNSLEKAGVTCK